jgi:hypothetical protein
VSLASTGIESLCLKVYRCCWVRNNRQWTCGCCLQCSVLSRAHCSTVLCRRGESPTSVHVLEGWVGWQGSLQGEILSSIWSFEHNLQASYRGHCAEGIACARCSASADVPRRCTCLVLCRSSWRSATRVCQSFAVRMPSYSSCVEAGRQGMPRPGCRTPLALMLATPVPRPSRCVTGL